MFYSNWSRIRRGAGVGEPPLPSTISCDKISREGWRLEHERCQRDSRRREDVRSLYQQMLTSPVSLSTTDALHQRLDSSGLEPTAQLRDYVKP